MLTDPEIEDGVREKITSHFYLRWSDGVIPIRLRQDAVVATNVQSSQGGFGKTMMKLIFLIGGTGVSPVPVGNLSLEKL